MSLYNMLFGRNSQSELLLAVIGFKEVDVERLRDVFTEDDGRTIAVYTRTGGGNRSDYPQTALYRSPLFASTVDDDYDTTYATFRFRVPDEFVSDVNGLADLLTHGLRAEFAQHVAKTLRREPTDADKESAAYATEAAKLSRTAHFKANGHTFVPQSDAAMRAALELAEANGGSLRSCWGILPLAITVKRDFFPYPKAKNPATAKAMTRIETNYQWEIDEAYWTHCQEVFSAEFPVSMAAIADDVARHLDKAKTA